MTAIIIISAVVLLAVFLLASFIRVELEYDGRIFLKVKYLLFSRVIMPETKKSIRRKKKKEKREKKKQEKLLKKREKLRRKKLRGQHLKKSSSAKKASSVGTSPKTASQTKSKAEPKTETKTDTKTDSKADSKTDAKADSPPSPKTRAAQEAPQAAKRAETKNTDFNSSSDKSGNVKISDKVNAQKRNSEESEKPKTDLKLIVSCVNAAKPYVKRVFKKIRIYDVFAEIVVGGSDAASTAISYGVHCAAVHGAVCFLKNNASFKAKKIDIKADFDLEKTDYYLYCRVKLRLSTLLFCLLWGTAAVKNAMEGGDRKKQADKAKKTSKKAA